MANTKSETLDWALWFYWIMATTLGWLLGSSLFRGIPIIISGAVIAAFQWTVLYKRTQKAWRWIVWSSVGWITGYILYILLLSAISEFLLGPVIGVAVGITQWFILRTEVNWAGWWIIFSILGWTTGFTLLPGMLTTGALPGALTGLTLVILFRFSPQK